MEDNVLRMVLGEDFQTLSNPKLSRRQTIALNAFQDLNRNRTFISLPTRLKPNYINDLDISAAHAKLHTPISLEFFSILIKALDDTFIQFSDEQIHS